MYCKMCGTENQENAKFCYKCGEKLVENTIFSNGNEIVTEAKENKNIELDEFQKKYIEGLKDKLYKIDELESDELERIYLKSKSYNISQEYIDSIIMQKKEDKDKLFAYITMLYDENSKFDLSDEEEEEIINFGQRLKLSEENVREYLENYNRQNNITEKADLYEKIVKSYIGECFSEVFKEDLGNDKNALQEERRIVKSGLDEEEYKIVESCVKKNVKNVLGVIEKKYSSLGNENLSENQMSDIVMYGERYDLETADVTLLISIVEKRIGVFDKRRTKFVDDFKKRIDDLLSEEIVFAGKKRVLEGKYFLEDYIYPELFMRH